MKTRALILTALVLLICSDPLWAQSNDAKANATLLTNIHNWSSADAVYSNVSATPDAATAAGCGSNPQHNVWFKFQATTNEIELKVTNRGSKGTLNYPSVILFDPSGNVVACHDPNGGTAFLQITTLTPGTMYYFSVDNLAADPGTFTLSVTDGIGYDLQAKAELLTNIHNWSSADAAYSNVGATPDAATASGCGSNPQHNVWFKFQATTNEIELKVLNGGSKGTLNYPSVILFDPSGNVIACHTANGNTAFLQIITLTPGSMYYFSVDNFSTAGNFTLNVTDSIGYDMKEKSLFLEETTGWTSPDAFYKTDGATPDAMSCGGRSTQNNVWFAFQAATNEVEIKVMAGGTKGNLLYPILGLFDGKGNNIACNVEQNNSVVQSNSLIPDSIYFISVDNAVPGTGPFTLSVDDELTFNYHSKAKQIADVSSWVSDDAAYSNDNATPDFSGSPCGGPFHNVWFTFTATAGNIAVQVLSGGTKGTLQYPLITLYDEDSIPVACNGGFLKALIDSTTVTPGKIYYLSVDNYQGSTGTFTVQIKNNDDNSLINCVPTHADEYNALMALYAATNGSAWINNAGWRDANPGVVQSVQGWYGVTVNGQGHIVMLNLVNNNLTGKIPASIGNLRALHKLSLSNNHLTDGIPDEVGNLICLNELRINNNQLTGIIPPVLGNMADLSALDMGSNKLGGIIPLALGRLTNLNYLNISNNNVGGVLPESFGSLVHLDTLDLSVNDLTNVIPDSLGNMNELRVLRLDSNSFIGSIPAAIGRLTQLKELNLGYNQLSGAIPVEMGSMNGLTSLILEYNQLTDSVPSSFGGLTQLKKLYLNNNAIVGTVTFISSLTGLRELIISDNEFSGALSGLSPLTHLEKLWVSNNNFTSVSTEILGLSAVNSVRLDNNGVTSLPDFSTHVNKTNLDLSVTQNVLTFSQLLPLVNAGLHTYTYSPQKRIDKIKTIKAALGQSLTLITSIDRNVNPLLVYQWFRMDGVTETPLNSASTSGHTVILPAVAQADVGSVYFYKISAPGNELILVSNLQTFQAAICNTVALDFQIERHDGKYQFTPIFDTGDEVCNITYLWDFGDGTTSAEQIPDHVYATGGNYTINLNVSYACDGCRGASATQQHPVSIDQSFCGMIYCDGNGLGIGTTQVPTGYILAVKGKVIMEGAKVALQSRWPDYVFEKGYKMMPIPQLKEYVSENHHLPDVPSAEMVQKEGIDISDMNAVLLRKIEELTLYMIQLDDQVKALENKNKK